MKQRQRKTQYWRPDRDYTGTGPLCDPRHPTAANKRHQKYWLDQYLAAGDLVTVRKILAAYPYWWPQYARRVSRAETTAELGLQDLQEDYDNGDASAA